MSIRKFFASSLGALLATSAVAGVFGSAVLFTGSAGADTIPASCTPSATMMTCSFTYTGAEQLFTVPSDVQNVLVQVTGASGGIVPSPAGDPLETLSQGATDTATLTDVSGNTYDVEVGGTPTTSAGNCALGIACIGGFNGGGSSYFGAGGGGASDIRTVSQAITDSPTSLASRILVAAGGGGGGAATVCGLGGSFVGGSGGAAGLAGIVGGLCGDLTGLLATGGGGGTQLAGGAAPTALLTALLSTIGTAGVSGFGGSSLLSTGGGGGGGLFGGGSGGTLGLLSLLGDIGGTGGGGGSSLIPLGDLNVPSLTSNPASVLFSWPLASQVVSFTSNPLAGVSSYTPTAITSGLSGNPITYAINTLTSTPGVCSLTNGTVNFTGIGTCVLDATQAATNQDGLGFASQTIPVGLLAQVINFTSTPPSLAAVGGSGSLPVATGGGSGNPIDFTSATTAVCTITGGLVNYLSPGTCTIDANQAGSSTYSAANQVVQSFAVTAASTQPSLPSTGGLLMAATPDRLGYWLTNAKGAVSAFGDAVNYGSVAGHLNAPVVGITPTPDGQGYWLAASDGGVFSFGDAVYQGGMGGTHLNKPVVGIIATPTGQGYWLVASDGGVFTFGNAPFEGSLGAIHLNAPITGIASTPDGKGYWLVAPDGGVFTFGDAKFFGSLGATHLNKPIVSMTSTPDGKGYWLVAYDGGVFTFGDAAYLGSLGGTHQSNPVIGLIPTALGNAYTLVNTLGVASPFGSTL